MNSSNNTNKYSDIIDLPHKQSFKRPQMSRIDRAAQFAPFAALTGYDDAIKETGRLTDKKIEMSDEELNVLNVKFQLLSDSLGEDNEVVFTYFKPDKSKAGGFYETASGVVKKLDDYERLIVLQDGTRIPMDDIYSIDGDIFNSAE